MGAHLSKQRNQKPENDLTENTSLNLLAWCSNKNNEISLFDLKAKEEFAHFDGVKLTNRGALDINFPAIKEIPNSGLLVSANHDDTANLKVFGVNAKKKQVKRIFSFEEIPGNIGDLAFNSKRGFLGAISVSGKIAYHLYQIDTSRVDDAVKLIRKSRWHEKHSTLEKNMITGFDFHPGGELMATEDMDNTYLISDVNTNDYRFHVNSGTNRVASTCCKWSTNICDPFLYITHSRNKLNILDAEKQALALKESVPIEDELTQTIYAVDVCPTDGNLVATGGLDGYVRIFDRRASRIVKNFKCPPYSKSVPAHISSVRWSPNGAMLASASYDTSVTLWNFPAGKVVSTKTTRDGSGAASVCFL